MQVKNIKKAKKSVKIFWITLLFGIVIIRIFVFSAVRVSGISMLPTLQDEQIIFVNKMAYWKNAPQNGDIVIVREPIDNIQVVKRIVGTPGTAITIEDKTFILKEDEYYIEGDNRDNSIDSRAYGPIRSERIIGKVIK